VTGIKSESLTTFIGIGTDIGYVCPNAAARAGRIGKRKKNSSEEKRLRVDSS